MIRRRKPLRRSRETPRRTGYVARSRAERPRGGSRDPSPQQERRKAREDEWAEYSRDVRRRRPRCEAGPRWAEAVPELRAAGLLTPRLLARIERARDECAGTVSGVHHKSPRNRGPMVPSEGLGEDDVVSICSACHDAAENNLIVPARLLDLVR